MIYLITTGCFLDYESLLKRLVFLLIQPLANDLSKEKLFYNKNHFSTLYE